MIHPVLRPSFFAVLQLVRFYGPAHPAPLQKAPALYFPLHTRTEFQVAYHGRSPLYPAAFGPMVTRPRWGRVVDRRGAPRVTALVMEEMDRKDARVAVDYGE